MTDKKTSKAQSTDDLNEMNDGNKIFEMQEKAREEKRKQEEEALEQSAEAGR